MMKKPKKSPLGIAKLTFLVPVLLIAMALTTGMTPQEKQTIKGTVIEAVSGEVMPGTSIVVKGGTTGCVADIDGSFSLTIPGDPELVFSFVGYKTQIVRASKIGEKPIILETTVTTYDLDDVSAGGISFRASDGIGIESKKDGKAPVILLDGEVVMEFDNVDPEEIKSISVIKDPEHELIKKYNAENGLIIIKTKSATYISKQGKTSIKKTGKAPDNNEPVFYVVEDMPRFPGGKVALKSYIYSNLVYPKKAQKKKIEGEVVVQFKVLASGELKNIKVVKSDYQGFDEAAMDVFKSMPAWSPGKQRGKSVQVMVNIPVVFSLDKK